MKKTIILSIIVLLTVFTYSNSECSLIMNLEGHSSGIDNISYSPDGKYLLSRSYDNSIKIWLVEDGNCIRTFKGNYVLFSPDGKYLAIGNDNTIKLFSIEDFHYIRKLKVCSNLRSFTFSHNSKLIGTSNYGLKAIELWRVENGSLFRTITTKHYTFRFSPDDKLLETLSLRKDNIKLWSVEDGSCMKTFNISDIHSLGSARFISNGKYLASIIIGDRSGYFYSKYYSMTIWSLEDGNCIRTINLGNNTNDIYNFKFSPDEEFFAFTRSGRNNIKLWSVNDGRCIKKIQGYPDEVGPNGGISSICFSPDGTYIAIGSSDVSTIKIWGIHKEVISNLISKLQSINLKYYYQQMNEIDPLFKRKGEFETQEDYNDRIKLAEIEKLKIENLYEEKMQKERRQIKEKLKNMLDKIYPPEIVSKPRLGRYDADKEIYKIDINNKVYEFKVLRDIAKNFKDKFSKYKITMQKKYHLTNNYELKTEIINIKLEKDDGTVCNIFEKVN